MALTPKQEEKLWLIEEQLRELGERLSPEEIATLGPRLNSPKLEDAFRAAIYVERIHQRSTDDWDGLLPVDAFMATFRDSI